MVTKKLKQFGYIRFYLLISAVICLTILNGCSGLSKAQRAVKNDGPPLVDRDVSKIPNATPKVEPKSKYGNPESYKVFGKKYKVMHSSKGYNKIGEASWYGRQFHGKRTSSGESYDMFGMTAAHKSLPLPTYVKVQNLTNGKEVIVKVNDRGPFIDDRIIDLSYAAAKKLGVTTTGTAKVKVTAIDPKKHHRPKSTKILAQIEPSNKQIYVQLGAFSNQSNATKLVAEAEKMISQLAGPITERASLTIHPPSQTTKLHKVRLGPIASWQEADNIARKVSSLAKMNATVIID